MELTKKDILALDSRLFSAADKKAYIDLLYGNPQDWTWKRDLQSAAANMLRWKLFLAVGPKSGQLYRITHQDLMQRAKRSPPKRPATTVADFSDWIYRLYVPAKDYASLERGHWAEREIAKRRIPIPNHGRWKLLHNGMGENWSNAFSITSLAIDGIPLRGSPDLVFRERGTKRILIVEVKATDAMAPADGWPNMRAQLWAYAQIDDWITAPEVILIGEIWGLALGIRLRKVLRWRKGEQSFERDNGELFNCYRSYFNEPTNLVSADRN